MRLMIVDDNADMRRLVTSFVKKNGDSIVECEDGSQAVESYRNFLPDWVLMDIEMPIKDGLTATREICAAYPHARVVMVTRHSDHATRAAAAEAGACHYVQKENLFELRGILRQA